STCRWNRRMKAGRSPWTKDSRPEKNASPNTQGDGCSLFVMAVRSILASVAVLLATFSLSAQQPVARLVQAESGVRLNGQVIAAGANATTLGNVADLQTAQGRVVIALKQGGTLVLGANSSARVLGNGVYNFNRIELLAGSAVLLTASNSGMVACGTDA